MGIIPRAGLSDAQWARLEPLLPPQRRRVGRPAHAHRPIVNGILWKLRTGAPWRDLPPEYGPWSTVACRFRRWRLAGVWDRVFAAVLQQEDAAGQVDWHLQFVDGTVIRAHQHAAGAKGGGPAPKLSAAAKGASAPKSTSRGTAAARG
jgi:transposase